MRDIFFERLRLVEPEHRVAPVALATVMLLGGLLGCSPGADSPAATLTPTQPALSETNVKALGKIIALLGPQTALVRLELPTTQPASFTGGTVIRLRATEATKFFYFRDYEAVGGVSASSMADLLPGEFIIVVFSPASYQEEDSSYAAVGIGRDIRLLGRR